AKTNPGARQLTRWRSEVATSPSQRSEGPSGWCETKSAWPAGPLKHGGDPNGRHRGGVRPDREQDPAEWPAARPPGTEPPTPLRNNPLSPRPELLFLSRPAFSSWPDRPVKWPTVLGNPAPALRCGNRNAPADAAPGRWPPDDCWWRRRPGIRAPPGRPEARAIARELAHRDAD